jgi:hypothetical protein
MEQHHIGKFVVEMIFHSDDIMRFFWGETILKHAYESVFGFHIARKWILAVV